MSKILQNMLLYFKPFSIILLQFFFRFFLSFPLKIVVFEENIAENCRMPGLCQIHIKGDIAVCCQIFPLNIQRTGITFHDSLNLKEFDAAVNLVLRSTEGPHHK